MFGIEQKVAHAAKRAGLLSGGLLLCSVGVGFLTVGGWFALATIVGVQNTALIIAAIYLGLGFVMLGLSAQRTPQDKHQRAKARAAESAVSSPIVAAFMYGLQAGAHADRARR